MGCFRESWGHRFHAALQRDLHDAAGGGMRVTSIAYASAAFPATDRAIIDAAELGALADRKAQRVPSLPKLR